MRVVLVMLIVSIYSLPAAAQSEDSWTRAQALEPGSEILLTVARTRPVQRYVIAVDDNSVRVLNLDEAPLSGPWPKRCDRSCRNTPTISPGRRLKARWS